MFFCFWLTIGNASIAAVTAIATGLLFVVLMQPIVTVSARRGRGDSSSPDFDGTK